MKLLQKLIADKQAEGYAKGVIIRTQYRPPEKEKPFSYLKGFYVLTMTTI